MKIAIDISPLVTENKYRGIGSYTRSLLSSLRSLDKDNQYNEINTFNKVNQNYDLLIIPYFNPFQFSLPFNKKIKTIITIHDLIPLKYPDKFPVGIKGKLIWSIQKMLLNKFDGFLTDSNNSKKEIAEIADIVLDKIYVVYPPFSTKYRPIKDNILLNKLKRRYKLPEQFILYVGDCNWNKNLPILIKAVKRLKLSLVLVGKVFTQSNINLDHPWNLDLKKVLDLCQKESKIIRLGYLPEDDLVGIYSLATVYVQPSFDEGFGLPVVEAMASGCPVIVSSTLTLKEVVGDAAIYFNPEDIDDLMTKINLIFSQSQIRKELRLKGINRAKRYKVDRVVKSIKDVYRKILSVS